MADPIADNWKAMHDPMRQMKAEESASHLPCPRCNDSGWLPDCGVVSVPTWFTFVMFAGIQRTCPPPDPERQNGPGRAIP
jgi:hypothetical protein